VKGGDIGGGGAHRDRGVLGDLVAVQAAGVVRQRGVSVAIVVSRVKVSVAFAVLSARVGVGGNDVYCPSAVGAM
jgi:hypothetical protein